MHVTEQPEHWQRRGPNSQRGRPHVEYAHVHAVDGPSIPPARVLGFPSRSREHGGRPALGGLDRRRGRRNSKKRFGLSDPAVWNAIQRTMAQQNRLSSIIPCNVSRGRAGIFRRPSVPSRTSSRRKALDRFARELKKYAHVAGAAGRLPVITPTESEEKDSLHTVKPLIPYMHEFEAAGLAVTSEQQRQWSTEKIDDQRSHRECIIVDRHCCPKPHEANLDGQYESPTLSSSTSGSVVEFTPPHAIHASWAEPISVKKESPPSPVKDTRATSRIRLPWLRKKQPVKETVTPHQRIGTMMETKKGEWRLSSKETNSRPQAPEVPLNKQAEHDGDKTKKQTARTVAPPQISAQARPRIVRPYVAEYVKNPPRHIEKNMCTAGTDFKPQFRRERDLAQASLPRRTQAIRIADHNHPFFQRHHHSPFHRVSHVHGAPVVLAARKPERSPTRQPQKPFTEVGYSEQKPLSPAPELPYTWKYAVSNASSMERALNAAQNRIEKKESQTVDPLRPAAGVKDSAECVKQLKQREEHGHRHHPLLAKTACLDHQAFGYSRKPAEPTLTTEYVKTGTTFEQESTRLKNNQDSIPTKAQTEALQQQPDRSRSPIQIRSPLASKDNVAKTMDQVGVAASPLVIEPGRQSYLLAKENDRNQNQDASDAIHYTRPALRLGESVAIPTKPHSELETALNDLDVFSETDDAAINDRDVLRGLQVAVKAAADDMYDALIRNKTGLRIRRFLADLKSVDIIDAELATDHSHRQRRTEKRRSEKAGHR